MQQKPHSSVTLPDTLQRKRETYSSLKISQIEEIGILRCHAPVLSIKLSGELWLRFQNPEIYLKSPIKQPVHQMLPRQNYLLCLYTLWPGMTVPMFALGFSTLQTYTAASCVWIKGLTHTVTIRAPSVLPQETISVFLKFCWNSTFFQGLQL